MSEEIKQENLEVTPEAVPAEEEATQEENEVIIEEGDPEKGEPAIRSFTQKVEPNKYHVVIKPEDWSSKASVPRCRIEVEGLHENCICHVYPDEEVTMNKSKDRAAATRLLKDVFDGDFAAKTKNNFLECEFDGPTPTESLYLDIEELPFFDVPGSAFGIT